LLDRYIDWQFPTNFFITANNGWFDSFNISCQSAIPNAFAYSDGKAVAN
jgi:hypothetical protein